MMSSRLGTVFAGLLVTFVIVVEGCAADRLEIKYNRDTAYLPYKITELSSYDYGTTSRSLARSISVLEPSTADIPEGLFVRAYNPAMNVDYPAIFSLIEFPSLHLITDNPVYLTVNDYRVYFDDRQRRKAVASAGYKNDSAFAFRFVPETEEVERVFLVAGKDSTGDGRWDPTIEVLLVEDYDYDGLNEAFIHVNSSREYVPRVLFCVEMETLRVEWSLDVAAPILRRSFYNRKDSLDPSIIFVAYNPKQGVRDANFDDNYGYLAIVNARGQVVYNRVIASQHGGMSLCRANRADYFYLTHEITFADPSEFSGEISSVFHVTLLRGDGLVERTVDVDQPTTEVWMGDYTGREYGVPFVRTGGNGQQVRVYDTSLTLLAESEPVMLGSFLGRAAIEGQADSALLFSDAIYSADLKKLAILPFSATEVVPLSQDSSGHVTAVALNGLNRYLIGTVDRKDMVELLSIFYVRNKAYVLAALFSLLVLLLVANYYRSRTKHHLHIIEAQKAELERTHEALRLAQRRIIEQEKYEQAKDIAGGFAHEIRNALFPAEAAMKKLVKNPSGSSADARHEDRYLSLIEGAVSRAVDLTELITEYTTLDSGYRPDDTVIGKVIDEVVSANRLNLEDRGIDLKVLGETGTGVIANYQQMIVVLNNLVMNSIDALTNISDPVIFIQVETGAEVVQVSVADNGSGIDDAIAPRIFDTFFSTKPQQGTGLGLSIAKRIVEMYGGSVVLEPRDGDLTRFTIRLKPALRSQESKLQ